MYTFICVCVCVILFIEEKVVYGPSPMKGFFPQERWEDGCYNESKWCEYCCENRSLFLYRPNLYPVSNAIDNQPLPCFKQIHMSTRKIKCAKDKYLVKFLSVCARACVSYVYFI